MKTFTHITVIPPSKLPELINNPPKSLLETNHEIIIWWDKLKAEIKKQRGNAAFNQKN